MSTDALAPASSTVDHAPTTVDHHRMQSDEPEEDDGGDAHDDDQLDDDQLDDDQVDVDVEEEEVEEEEGYDSSSSPSTNTSTLTWITWFCSLPGHEYFCEIAEDFIEDDFNLTGLSGLVPFYKEAMEMVLDVEAGEYHPPLSSREAHRVPDVSIVESSAELLYGLIHQRYILTRQGLQQMASHPLPYAKFDASNFGTCPRVYCSLSKLVPCGRSDLPGVDTVKLYCASCVEMYTPPSSRYQGVDGAFFGTTFPHLLFQTYPSPLTFPPPAPTPPNTTDSEPNATRRRELTTPTTSLAKVYVPRIYGFKVSERARSGPRMQWLRMRPRTESELDWSDQDDDLGLHPDEDDGDETRRAHRGGGGGGGGRGKLFGDDDEDEQGEPNNQSEDASDQDDLVGAGGGEGDGASGITPREPMQMSGVVVAEKQASLSESVRRHVARAKKEMVRFTSGGGVGNGNGNGKVMAVRSTSVGVGA